MKILVIGASGFIGSSIIHDLKKKYDVFGISRKKIENKNFCIVDLLDEHNCKEYFKKNNFDVIIYLASVMADKNSINDFSLIERNLKMTKNLINSLKDKDNGYLINFSSSAVYPNIDGVFDEESKIDSSKNSDCLYGLSKFNNEMLFNHFLKNFKILNLRVGYVYGKKMNDTRIHKIFENEILDKNQITIWGDGSRTFPQLSIDYLIDSVLKMIEKKLEGTYNLAEENISLNDLAKRFVKLFGDFESKILYNDKIQNNRKFKMDLRKFKKL